jgi:putative acetyltransferase
MFEEYSKLKSVYFVVEKEGEILGCAGIALENEEKQSANFKKCILPETRGLGGSQMMATCLQSAKDFGFEKCYLETMPFMLDAQNYTKVGFRIHLFSMEAQATRVALFGC